MKKIYYCPKATRLELFGEPVLNDPSKLEIITGGGEGGGEVITNPDEVWTRQHGNSLWDNWSDDK